MTENVKQLSRIKPVFKCSQVHKDKFSASTCLLTISVGQEVHEGEKFDVTIQLINGQFKHITILIDDVLQRHSMMLVSHQSAEEVYQHSLEEGDRWLERNRHLYEQLTCDYTIIRWEHWLLHPEYQSTHQQIRCLYNQDPEFKQSLDSTASIFLERFTRRQPDLTKDPETAFQLCLDYLFEECTALCLWVEGKYNFEVYPSPRNLAMSMTHQRLVLPQYPDYLWPVAIKFKNRKQLKPQSFNINVQDTAPLELEAIE